MLKIETKISGWSINNFKHIIPMFDNEFISLDKVMELDLKQEVMDYILDTFRFSRGARVQGCKNKKNIWIACIDWDTIYKLTIWEKYPEEEEELTKTFGDEWYKLYLRFGH